MPRFVTTRVYMKPLLPGAGSNNLDLRKVLERSKRDLLRRLKANLRQAAFSEQARRVLGKAVTVKIMPSSLHVIANHPAFRPLVEGQRSKQMTWLTKAKAPIPIVLDTGKLIFRSATPRSMADGKWWHPGRASSNYIDKAKEETRQYIRDKLAKEVVRQLSKSLASALKRASQGR